MEKLCEEHQTQIMEPLINLYIEIQRLDLSLNLDIGMEHVSQPYVMLLDTFYTITNTLNDVMPHFIKI